MKEDKYLKNLKHIINPEEAKPLIDNDMNIPIPKRIRDMVREARAKQKIIDSQSTGILDKLVDFITPTESIGSVAFGIDGTEDEEEPDDPLVDELLKDEDDEK